MDFGGGGEVVLAVLRMGVLVKHSSLWDSSCYILGSALKVVYVGHS